MLKNTNKYEPKNIVLTIKDNVSLGQVGGNYNTRLKINYNDIEHKYYEVENKIEEENIGFKEINESPIIINTDIKEEKEIPANNKTIIKETNETLVRGFFTENVEISADKNFMAYIEKLHADTSNKYNKYFAAFFDNFARTHNPKNHASQLHDTLLNTTGIDFDVIAETDKKGYIDITNTNYLPNITPEQAIDNLINLISNNLDETLRISFLQDIDADRNFSAVPIYLADLFNESTTYIHKNLRNQRAAIQLHGQNSEGNINERNNAMYEYAVLLIQNAHTCIL